MLTEQFKNNDSKVFCRCFWIDKVQSFLIAFVKSFALCISISFWNRNLCSHQEMSIRRIAVRTNQIFDLFSRHFLHPEFLSQNNCKHLTIVIWYCPVTIKKTVSGNEYPKAAFWLFIFMAIPIWTLVRFWANHAWVHASVFQPPKSIQAAFERNASHSFQTNAAKAVHWITPSTFIPASVSKAATSCASPCIARL